MRRSWCPLLGEFASGGGSILITIISSLVFCLPEGNHGDHDDQWRWLQWIKMSSQRLFFQGGDILRLWKERCWCGSNCGFSRTEQGAAKKKRISLVLIFPFPRIFAWMSHLKTIDAYPLSDPPPVADHGNVLAWRADPQSNHWRHRCHPLIINTTKKIDVTLISYYSQCLSHETVVQIRSKDESRSPVRGGGRGSLTAPSSRKTSAVGEVGRRWWWWWWSDLVDGVGRDHHHDKEDQKATIKLLRYDVLSMVMTKIFLMPEELDDRNDSHEDDNGEGMMLHWSLLWWHRTMTMMMVMIIKMLT